MRQTLYEVSTKPDADKRGCHGLSRIIPTAEVAQLIRSNPPHPLNSRSIFGLLKNGTDAEQDAESRADTCADACAESGVRWDKYHRVYYYCVISIQFFSFKVQNGTDAESCADLFAEICAGEMKNCANAAYCVVDFAEKFAPMQKLCRWRKQRNRNFRIV